MVETNPTPPAEEPVAHATRPLWRQLLVALLITIAIGSAVLLGVACYAALHLLTDGNKGEGHGPAFAFAYVVIVLASAAATLILSAGAVWLLVRRPRGGTAGRVTSPWAWSPLRVAITLLVLILLLRVSTFGLALLFGLGDNQVFQIFHDVLQWATLFGPLLAVLLVHGLRRRIGHAS
jgi:hypothetical protein